MQKNVTLGQFAMIAVGGFALGFVRALTERRPKTEQPQAPQMIHVQGHLPGQPPIRL